MASTSLTPKGENWVAVCPLDRLAHQTIVRVRLEAVDLLLVREGDDVFACQRSCPHEEVDLSLGRVTDGRIFYPRHYASFDLRDGMVVIYGKYYPDDDKERVWVGSASRERNATSRVAEGVSKFGCAAGHYVQHCAD